jgi:predicted nuclease with TOPRIM domain
MFNFHKNHVNHPTTGIGSGEDLIKNKYKDLQQKFQELQSVKKNIKKLVRDIERQDAKYTMQKERLISKTKDWEETL